MRRGRTQEHGGGRTTQPGQCRVNVRRHRLVESGHQEPGRLRWRAGDWPCRQGGSHSEGPEQGRATSDVVTVTLTPVLKMRSRGLRGEGRRPCRCPMRSQRGHRHRQMCAGHLNLLAWSPESRQEGRDSGAVSLQMATEDWRAGKIAEGNRRRKSRNYPPPPPNPPSVEPLTERGWTGTSKSLGTGDWSQKNRVF